MKNNKIVLIAFITLITLITSCKEKDEIGLDRPVNFLETTLIENTAIESYTMLDNTYEVTDNATYGLVGAYEDDVVGTLRAYNYTQFRMLNDYPDFGLNFSCDSVVLQLNYSVSLDGTSHTYGDTTATMPISVWEISEDFNPTKLYRSTDELAVSKKLGETDLNFKPQPNNRRGTRITLDQATGYEIMLKSHLQSIEAFVFNFKGLKIGASDGYFGAVLGIENMSIYTKMTVYYRNTSGVGLSYDYYPNNDCRRFNQYIPDYTGTTIEPLKVVGDRINSTDMSNTLVVQSGTGVGTLLKFPEIENLLDTTELLSIVKAELVMSVEEVTTSSFVDEPNEVFTAYEVENGVIKVNSTGVPVSVSNDDLLSGEFGSSLFYYNPLSKTYTLPLTNHFENYQKGDKISLDLLIQSYLSDTRINRSIMSNQVGTKPLKLKFYYTVMK